MGLRLVTPAEPLLSLEAAKRQLHLYHDADDADVAHYVASATDWLETRTRRAFMPRTLELVLPEFPLDGGLTFPTPPLASVESVTYRDAEGVEQTLPPESYVVATAALFGVLHLAHGASWPVTEEHPEAVVVRFVAGYAAPLTPPPRAVQVVRWMTAHQYTNREPVTVGGSGAELPLAIRQYVGSLRIITLP